MPTKVRYQYDYSKINPKAVFDHAFRTRKAKTILAVLSNHFSGTCNRLTLLDIGCASGIIADHLAPHFLRVRGIDIDENAIRFAKSHFHRSNLSFQLQDCLQLDFPPNCFDAVICAHVYEHVPDAKRLIAEIKRVLKPGGACYFAAGNRLALREPHYGLFFLSWLPKTAANAYLRLFRKGRRYYENHLSLWGLQRLVRGFTLHDYTRRLIEDPQAFGLAYLLRPGSWRQRLAVRALRHFYWLCPTYIWLLEKADPADD